jgi:hypothetical protein
MTEYSAKEIRAARKAKAERMGSAGERGKVDASGWTPPEPLNAEGKTGLRPVSPRQYKRGGHVEGHEAHHHAGRKARKAGGGVNAYMNRDGKEANAKLGKPHVGGYKHGGHADEKEDRALIDRMVKKEARTGRKDGGEAGHWISGAIKHSGALHKSLGVPKGEKIPEKKLEKAEHSRNPKTAKRARLAETLKGMHHEERGGRANYEGGTRPTGGRIARASGGSILPKESLMGQGLQKHIKKAESDDDLHRIRSSLEHHKMFVPPHLAEIPRPTRATGGKAKGKTNIVIAVNPHGGQDGQMMAPGAGPVPPPRPPVQPVPVAPPAQGMPMGGMPRGGMPPGMPPQMPPGAMPPGGMMPRKKGGRVHTPADMTAGAGGAEGRLEKIALQR